MNVGRQRTKRKDLPPGLLFDARRKRYYYRARRAGKDAYADLGADRAQAIVAYWKLVTVAPPAAPNTVAALIERYLEDELPRRVKVKKLKAITAKGYTSLAPIAVKEFGAFVVARTAVEAMMPDTRTLCTAAVDAFLRRFEGEKGQTQANRVVALLSAVYAFARRSGATSYNPCEGCERNEESARKMVQPQATRTKLLDAAHPALRLIAELSDLTAMRKTDARLLTLQQVGEAEITVRQSKTGKAQAFAITPAVRAILTQAAKLPGRMRSMYVFPTRKGTPYTESGLQSAWRRAKKAAGMGEVDFVFRDFRTTALNAARKEGRSAKQLAGHADERTTERHYLDEPEKVRPLR